jgi:hypothetical protein
MALLQFAEIFGHDILNQGPVAISDRTQKRCRFQNCDCTKVSATDPLGICSFSDGQTATSVCPMRFQENGVIFQDVGRLAFGAGVRIVAAPEIRLLRTRGSSQRKIGKVDFLLAKLDANNQPVDFAAMEVQAVYISGKSVRPAFNHFVRTGNLTGQDSRRRPDYRSSAQKRLMPQLSLKVPVFRRWGKKFFVVVDSMFFGQLPPIKSVQSIANSEITWLVYPLQKSGSAYSFGAPSVRFTVWDDVLTALREGQQPEPDEILAEIAGKLSVLPKFTT